MKYSEFVLKNIGHKIDFDISNNEFRCCYNDLKKAYIG